jgi:hypothetical protein
VAAVATYKEIGDKEVAGRLAGEWCAQLATCSASTMAIASVSQDSTSSVAWSVCLPGRLLLWESELMTRSEIPRTVSLMCLYGAHQRSALRVRLERESSLQGTIYHV